MQCWKKMTLVLPSFLFARQIIEVDLSREEEVVKQTRVAGDLDRSEGAE